MKKNIFLNLMMLVASVATLSAQDELDKTTAPQMWVLHVDETEQCVLVEFECGEVAVIHVLVDGEEVMQGGYSCEYKIPCLYVEQEFVVSAYAQAEGKLPSDTITKLVVVPALKLEVPHIIININEFDPDLWDYSLAYGGFYTRPYATIGYPYSYETEVTVFYRMGARGEHDEFEWSQWAEYEYGGNDDEGNLQHLTYETDDPTISVTIEAYASFNNGPESEHVWTEFLPIQPMDKPWWAECDFKRGDVYYKVTSDSTLSVCTKTRDQYDYAPMYDGAYSGDVIIPETIVVHSDHTFTVTGIDQHAFANCPQLTSVSMPSTITFIGQGAFEGDVLLSSIMIPSSVESIGSSAFEYCTGLTSLAIPSSVKTIGHHAFAGCSGLRSVTVASENTTYDSRDNCNGIIETASNTLIAGFNNTVIPSSVTSIGYGAYALCDLTSIDIPETITHIGDGAFACCNYLTSINIPSSVISIGDNAFEMTSLTDIVIPESVTIIGCAAFRSCHELKSMTCIAVTPQDVESIFGESGPDLYKNVKLYVPMESLGAYRAHEEWGKFTHIVPFIGAGPGDVNGDGKLSIGDVTGLIDVLLTGGELPAYCDVNGDGKVSIGDVTELINMLLSTN